MAHKITRLLIAAMLIVGIAAFSLSESEVTMPYIPQVKVGNTIYDIKDSRSYKGIEMIGKERGRLYKSNYTLNSGEIIFSSNEIASGTPMSCEFDIASDKTAFLQFLDGSDNVLLSVGKTTAYGALPVTHVNEFFKVPAGYTKCVAKGAYGYKIDILLKFVEENEDYIYQNTGIASNTQLFNVTDVLPGEHLYYDFYVPADNKFGYLSFRNEAGTAIANYGKTSSGGDITHVTGFLKVPEGYSYCVFQTNSTAYDYANITIQRLREKEWYTYDESRQYIANSNSLLFDRTVMPEGEYIECEFDIPETRAIYIRILDKNGEVIENIGKLSATTTTGVTHCSFVYRLPMNYDSCILAVNGSDTLLIDNVKIVRLSFGRWFTSGEEIETFVNSKALLFDRSVISGGSYITCDFDIGVSDTGWLEFRDINGNRIDIVGKTSAYTPEPVTHFHKTFMIPTTYVDCVFNGNGYRNQTLRISIASKPDDGSSSVNLMIGKNICFPGGDLHGEGYNFRMPFYQYLEDGTLLCGAELRAGSGADNDRISLVLCRSLDHGKTFIDHRIILPYDDTGKQHQCKSCGQFIYDVNTGRVFLFCFRENSDFDRTTSQGIPANYDADITYIYSDDNGATWSEELHLNLKTTGIAFVCPSPTNGIVMENGALVMPVWVEYANTNELRSGLVYSTDHGDTWQWGGIVGDPGNNECVAVEFNGNIILNCRNEYRKYRKMYITSDYGQTYTELPSSDYSLQTPTCSASMIKVQMDDTIGYLYSSPMSMNDRTHTELYYTNDFVTWRKIAQIDDSTTKGYTTLAVWNGHLVIGEERNDWRISCDHVALSQLSLASDAVKIPITTEVQAIPKGELWYDKSSGKLVFRDENGSIHTIAFVD